MICADSCDGITKYYTSNTVYACMEEQTEDQLTAYRRLIGHEADLVTTEDAVDINRLREKAAVLERERDTLRRELDRVYGLIRDVKADHALQEGNWATAKESDLARIKALKTALHESEESEASYAHAVEELTAECEQANKMITELKAQIRDLKTDHAMSETVSATAKVEYEMTIAELKAQVADKDNTIKTLQGLLANRAWEHTYNRVDIGTIEETVELKKANADLRLAMEKKAETFAGMSNTIADLKEKNNKLRAQIEKLEADTTTFRQSVCAMTTDKYQLQTTISELEAKVEQLQGAVAAGKDRLIKSLEQRARLQDSLEELIRENAELRCKLARFESLHP